VPLRPAARPHRRSSLRLLTVGGQHGTLGFLSSSPPAWGRWSPSSEALPAPMAGTSTSTDRGRFFIGGKGLGMLYAIKYHRPACPKHMGSNSRTADGGGGGGGGGGEMVDVAQADKSGNVDQERRLKSVATKNLGVGKDRASPVGHRKSDQRHRKVPDDVKSSRPCT